MARHCQYQTGLQKANLNGHLIGNLKMVMEILLPRDTGRRVRPRARARRARRRAKEKNAGNETCAVDLKTLRDPRSGRFMGCAICGDIAHWARECPNNDGRCRRTTAKGDTSRKDVNELADDKKEDAKKVKALTQSTHWDWEA